MTRYINMERRSGKTMMLIHTAFITGYPIITFNLSMREFVKKQAKDMGLNISVYALEEWLKYSRINKYHEKVLIDESQSIIDCALMEFLNADIVATTFSIPMIEKTDNKEADNEEKLQV